MKLSDILRNLNIDKIYGSTNIDISDIFYDSRYVKKNGLFVCLSGTNCDGHDFITDAIKNGAVAIVVEKNIKSKFDNITVIQVHDSRCFLANLSVNFYNNPAKELIKIGITGTKGKSTTSFMIKSILESANIKVGIIGTIGVVIGSKILKLNNTTPESYEIQKYMRKMVEYGCKYVIIEASSIGLKNHRLDGFEFDYGIFTNFSKDHIGDNEHKTMNDYLQSKSILFKKCNIGFINIDDNNYRDIINDNSCDIKAYGIINQNGNYGAENIEFTNNNANIGVKFDFYKEGKYVEKFYIGIPGKFNVYNALASISVCDFIGISLQHIKNGLENVRVIGRVEPIKISNDFSLFIDYAHNAVSMENLLTTFKEYNPKRIVTIFGAGGNRSKVRRYEMGEISGKYSDLSVITSDNPRFENPMDIINDIKVGINKTMGKYIVIPDRKEAIKYCIKNAQQGDIIILAGKGHEDYQEINGLKYPFDERKIISDIINDKF